MINCVWATVSTELFLNHTFGRVMSVYTVIRGYVYSDEEEGAFIDED
jgi:hypothetical protein